MNSATVVFLGVLAGLGPFAVEFYLPAHKHLLEHFQTSPALISLNVSIFFIGTAIGQFFGGPLSDANGRRPLTLLSLGLFTLASLLACFTTSIYTFVLLRGLQALGAGLVAVLANAIISDICNETNTAKYISLVTFIAIFIRILSPVAGGEMTTTYGWQAPLLVMAVMGLLTLVYVFLFQKESCPVEYRSRISMRSILQNYSHLLRDAHSRSFIGFEVFSTIGLFAYVSAAPLILMNSYGFDATQFGYLYAGTTFILMASAYTNNYLVGITGVARLTGITIISMFCIALILLLTPAYYRDNPALFLFLLCAYMIPMMMTRLNATAAAIKCFPHIAGASAALISVIGFTCGGLSSLSSGYLYEKYEFGLVWILFASASLNLLLYISSRKRMALHK